MLRMLIISLTIPLAIGAYAIVAVMVAGHLYTDPLSTCSKTESIMVGMVWPVFCIFLTILLSFYLIANKLCWMEPKIERVLRKYGHPSVGDEMIREADNYRREYWY